MTMNQQVRDERGAMSIIQVVLIAPALLLVLMFIVQYALVAHAQSVAEAAAEEGASVARRADGNEAGAQAEVVKYLEALGPKMLTDRSIAVRRTQETATVTVTGDVISLVPGIHPKVRETSSGPVERYVPPVEDGS
jgi:Flp pilus assembly protein TadG